MSDKNPEYDFKWCPGCGDFGVRRALEQAVARRLVEAEEPIEQTVVVAGIGCSGNLVHLLEGDQPFGIHGLHGRTLPVAFGVKTGKPDLNVVVVAGDGDFLSIGMEHIAPQAQRNLNVCAVVMDNGVYGLTKGQSSPTSEIGMITSSTPFGKAEEGLNPLRLYLTIGVSHIASALSSKIKDMANMIYDAMEYPGFSVVHVQSPCTEYNDTYKILKGEPRKGIPGRAWDIADDHDPSNIDAAASLLERDGIPLGLVYQAEPQPTMNQRLDDLKTKARALTTEQMVASYGV